MGLIFKILTFSQWQELDQIGVFYGAPVDRTDGFIHFSGADQVEETARKHFGGMAGLMLVAVDAAALGAALKYEASRGGARFPHYYGVLEKGHIVYARPLPLGADGLHDFRGLLA